MGNAKDRHRLPPLSHPVRDGDSFVLLGRSVEVLALAGSHRWPCCLSLAGLHHQWPTATT